MQKTMKAAVVREFGKPLVIDYEVFHHKLEELHKACEENSPVIKDLVADIVKTYHRAPVGV